MLLKIIFQYYSHLMLRCGRKEWFSWKLEPSESSGNIRPLLHRRIRRAKQWRHTVTYDTLVRYQERAGLIFARRFLVFQGVCRGGLGETGWEGQRYFPSATVTAAAHLIFCGQALSRRALASSCFVKIGTSPVHSLGSLRSTHPGRKMAFCVIDS